MKLLCSFLLAAALAGCGDSGGKPYGAACTKGDECASGACGGPNGPRTCDCASTSDCPMGQTCQLTIDTGRRCLPAPDASVGAP